MNEGIHKIALRRANCEVIAGLMQKLDGATFGAGKTSAAHLRWMCQELTEKLRNMPADKSGRWVGFIQGVMAANGVLDVDEERNRTRPIYETVYFTTETKENK